MSHATELIRQMIRKQGLHTIYPGQEESAFGDLLQTAWVQIERTLYKYRSRPHCRSCYREERPSESLLYIPADKEYGIKTMDEVIDMHDGACPHCKNDLLKEPIIVPEQDTYGGSDTILYRGKSKVFNMWSQISRTVILAYIKKEGRDRKNSSSYMAYLDDKPKPISDVVYRFIDEAREICKYNNDHLKILDGLVWLIEHDDRPYDGIIGKLVEQSGLSRTSVTSFLKIIRLRSLEFTDSPMNRGVDPLKSEKRRVTFVEFDEND